jgi:hypothetical protein
LFDWFLERESDVDSIGIGNGLDIKDRAYAGGCFAVTGEVFNGKLDGLFREELNDLLEGVTDRGMDSAEVC